VGFCAKLPEVWSDDFNKGESEEGPSDGAVDGPDRGMTRQSAPEQERGELEVRVLLLGFHRVSAVCLGSCRQ